MWLKYIYYISIFFHNILNSEAFVPNFYWRDFIPGYIPSDALEANTDGKYIGQVSFEGLLPAMIDPEAGVAVAEKNGKRFVKENIKILCTPEPNRFYWEQVSFSHQPGLQMKNTVRGGYEKYYSLFIGKIYDEKEWKIGKVIPYIDANSGLHLWNKQGRSIKFTEFQILKYNATILEKDCNIISDNESVKPTEKPQIK